MEHIDTLVIGAGVIGLACARALAQRGHDVLVLEREAAFGTGISARNSEVLHAGLYYPPASLKARLCVAGQRQLYAYCGERGIAHRRCGKLIVASQPGQTAALEHIAQRARANGVSALRMLSGAAARALEPQLAAHAALLSPSTGILDSHGLMLSLLGDLEAAGGGLALRCTVSTITVLSGAAAPQGGFVVTMADGSALTCRRLVNAAGLHAPQLAAHTHGLAAQHVPQAHYAKGSYFTLNARAPFRHLIYPVPEAAGLGIHLTLDLAGQARFGPDVEWVAQPEDFAVDPARAAAFATAIRLYWPALPADALHPAYAGIRPKLGDAQAPATDFVVQGPAEHGVAGLVNLFGIESPGLTSCLALAAWVAQRLDEAGPQERATTSS